MEAQNIPNIPTAESTVEVVDTEMANGGEASSSGGVSTKDLLMIFGSIALGIFITGNIIFNVSNYKKVQQLKQRVDSQE
jgi:3-keto-L-gulonate-6-phosphate decarboxylase